MATVSNPIAFAAIAFVVLWVVLLTSTFDLHARLDHEQSFSKDGAHRPSSPLEKGRAALLARVAALEKSIDSAEDELEHLVAAAAKTHHLRADHPTGKANWHPDGAAGGLAAVGSPGLTGPGVAEHPILALDEAAFRSTPMDALMAQYGTSGGGGTCDGDFGMGLIERWRGTGAPYCQGRSATSTNLKCYLVHQTKHHGGGDQLCLGTNVRVDYGRAGFADDSVTGAVVRNYIATKQGQRVGTLGIEYPAGTWGGTCNLDESLWRVDGSFPGWNLDWRNGFQTMPGSGGSDAELGCDVWEEQPTLVLQRDTFANFFHNSEVSLCGWVCQLRGVHNRPIAPFPS